MRQTLSEPAVRYLLLGLCDSGWKLEQGDYSQMCPRNVYESCGFQVAFHQTRLMSNHISRLRYCTHHAQAGLIQKLTCQGVSLVACDEA